MPTFDDYRPCPQCRGKGKTPLKRQCPSCEGKGWLLPEQKDPEPVRPKVSPLRVP